MKTFFALLLVLLAALFMVDTANAVVSPGPPNQADHPVYGSSTYLHIGDSEDYVNFLGISAFNEGGVIVNKTANQDCQWRISTPQNGCAMTGTTWSVRNANGTVTAYTYGIAIPFRRFCRYHGTVAGFDNSRHFYNTSSFTGLTVVDYCGTY